MPEVIYDAIQLNEAFNALNRIGQTSSRNEKEMIIRGNIKNPCFRKILLYTYNTYWTYNIRKLPEFYYNNYDPSSNQVSTYRFHIFFSILDKLKERELTGNKAIDTVVEFLSECNEIEGEWYMAVLFKDLDIGMTEKTVNKVEKGMIPVFDCMGALPFWRYPDRFIILFKLDGYRALAFHDDDGNVTLISRNGKQYFGFDDVEEEIKKLPRGRIYDGELMAKDKSFSGIQRQGTKKAKGKNANFYIFDTITIEDFNNSKNNQSWFERRSILKGILDSVDVEHIHLLKAFGVFDGEDDTTEDRVMKIYEVALKLGYEGLIIVDVESPYQFKKGRHWQKLKPSDDYDLEIIGFNEGSGKYEGTLGAIVVDYKGYPLRVGSGLIDKPSKNPNKYTRDYIWANRSKLIGMTIIVESDGETTNIKDDGLSLRFPRYKGFRFDK